MNFLNDQFSLMRYSNDRKSEWDLLVDNSRTPLFIFKRDYMDYHADRFDDFSILVYRNGRAVAALPCNESGSTIVSHGGLTYGGLITGIDVHADDILDILCSIIYFFKRAGKSEIIYKAVPRVFNNYPSDEELYALTRAGGKLYRRDLSSVIKMDARPRLSDSRKSTARKSSKAGVGVAELDDFNEFHSLLSHVLKKFNSKPVHTAYELELLKSRFPKNIRLFGSVRDNQLLAAVVAYDFGDIVHTQYMASSDEGRKIGSLDFLLIHLIETIFSKKSYFSFGISTESEGLVLNKGLIRQKEGFGGRGIVHDFYKIDLSGDEF